MKKYAKPLKFLVSGGTAALVEYASFILLIAIFNNQNLLLVAQIISFTAGLITSFLLNRTWVFKSDATIKKTFAKYLLLALINLLISTVLISLLAMIMPAYIAKLVVMVLIASWNYFIFQKLIF